MTNIDNYVIDPPINNIEVDGGSLLLKKTDGTEHSVALPLPSGGISTIENTSLGSAALDSRTSGVNNVAVGKDALTQSDIGNNNTAVGHEALASSVSGESNTGVGYRALYSLTTGVQNHALGYSAGRMITDGDDNVAVGYNTMRTPNATTTGNRQIAIGSFAGQASATQRNDTVAVGHGARYDADGAVALGSGAQALHAGSVALGQGSVTTGAAQVMVGARDVEISDTTKGVILRSPNGTRYRIQVADGGALSAIGA